MNSSRFINRLFAVLLGVSILVTAGHSGATSDRKVYPGCFCTSQLPDNTFVNAYYGWAGNPTANEIYFNCPIVADCSNLYDDSWISLLDLHPDYNFSCHIDNRDATSTGSSYSGGNATTSGTEGPVRETLTAPGTVPSYMYRFIYCTAVPPVYNSVYVSYVVAYEIDENC